MPVALIGEKYTGQGGGHSGIFNWVKVHRGARLSQSQSELASQVVIFSISRR